VVMKTKEILIQEARNRIDEYMNTIYAIVGFLNIYKYELSQENEEIIAFQGRKLYNDETKSKFITPDLGLVMSTGLGVIGEVKYSFPNNQEYWKTTFAQLKKYDSIISGWPTNDGTLKDYEVILLVHYTRSREVIKFYIDQIPEAEKVNKIFAIIEFSRVSQGQEYFNFRLEHGDISLSSVKEKLTKGLALPMEVYLASYAKIKINDVEPPLPLLLHLCYECAIDKTIGEGTFKKLTKKSKLQVNITLAEMTQRLREVYSFKTLQSKQFSNGQPEFPKTDWVRKAFNKLSEIGEGAWSDDKSGQFTYLLSQKEGDILTHYIQECSIEQFVQPELF
jgi:hypothetical protein